MFATDVPAFNIEGRRKYGTFCSFGLTLVLGFLLSFYMAVYLLRQDQMISSYTQKHDDNVKPLNEYHFKVAFLAQQNGSVVNLDWDPHFQEEKNGKIEKTKVQY